MDWGIMREVDGHKNNRCAHQLQNLNLDTRDSVKKIWCQMYTVKKIQRIFSNIYYTINYVSSRNKIFRWNCPYSLAEIFAHWDTGLSFCIFWDLKMKNLDRCQILIRRIGFFLSAIHILVCHESCNKLYWPSLRLKILYQSIF